MKQFLVLKTSVARQQETKEVVGRAAIFFFQLYSTDFTQAYLQRSDYRMEQVYLNLGKPNLKSHQRISLLKPLHGLVESGDYCERTVTKYFEENLGTRSCISYAALLLKSSVKF